MKNYYMIKRSERIKGEENIYFHVSTGQGDHTHLRSFLFSFYCLVNGNANQKEFLFIKLVLFRFWFEVANVMILQTLLKVCLIWSYRKWIASSGIYSVSRRVFLMIQMLKAVLEGRTFPSKNIPQSKFLLKPSLYLHQTTQKVTILLY